MSAAVEAAAQQRRPHKMLKIAYRLLIDCLSIAHRRQAPGNGDTRHLCAYATSRRRPTRRPLYRRALAQDHSAQLPTHS